MILVAFGLSFRQLSSFLSFATNSKSPIDSSNSGTDDLNPDGLVVDDSFPIVKLCKRAFRSVPNSALLIDSAVFIVLSLSLNEYWTSVIRPNHMHPGSGYAFPVCWLFEPRRQIGNEYWKNLRVEKQRCTDNLISFYGTVGVVVFTSMLVVVDASVHEKGLLIPPTT
ncbi:hypothetical protein GQ44DRAFT_107117 [Phaeosphaeriaceae sp. PMI808]|nr:hypothetical protein GQ44DRAFT_107117 [Phaeosphaeriaceae sp. PMI808]